MTAATVGVALLADLTLLPVLLLGRAANPRAATSLQRFGPPRSRSRLRWQALLARPIDERAQLRLERPTYYERSVPLHDAARSKSRAAAAQALAA